ncbi:glycoside hydrolase family 3 protein [Niameybacter massiliensis]|uniref:glycoside hydrolase family 3 protein n=1 Tax=Niameybacter massiliensis TaxID=1658108 RepID=UPI0006B4BC76|nr:glycoside hydrolase family 3 N-terminal domain-containing protein [Niameybacter massiliensis]
MEKLLSWVILIGLMSFIFIGCNKIDLEIGHGEKQFDSQVLPQNEPQSDSHPSDARMVEEIKEKQVLDYMNQMSIEEKIGQLFFVTVQQVAVNDKYGKDVGGVILFKDDITTIEETSKLVQGLQEQATTSLWIGIDEEGGRVSRVGNNEAMVNAPFKSAEAIGETGDTQVAYEEAKRMGKVLNSIGVNMNFAPDADIYNNPQNTVIGDRSFGKTAEEVIPMVMAFSKGLKEEEIIPVIKHFPGHGNTVEDSHVGLAYIDKTIKELEDEEMKPFLEATKNGVDVVMVGHLIVEEMDTLPATLSPRWGKYIEQNFDKEHTIFITDAMNMGAIIEDRGSGQATLMSFISGIDMILMPEQLDEAMEALKEAYEKGELSEERINKSVYKILLKKVEQKILVLE